MNELKMMEDLMIKCRLNSWVDMLNLAFNIEEVGSSSIFDVIKEDMLNKMSWVMVAESFS